MNYDKLRTDLTAFLALTSVSITLFDEILPFFTTARDQYSLWHDVKGKKRKHAVKNAVITCMAGSNLFTGLTVEGKMHDKKIADTMCSFPYECVLWQDTGYQGYTPENATIIQPVKKPGGRELTRERKEVNTEISRTRVKVEHAIGGARILRIVRDKCRLHRGGFVNKIFHLAAGLHNWTCLHRA